MKTLITLILILISPLSYSQTELFARVDSLIKPYKKSDSPGFSIGIVQNGNIIYRKGVGLANLEYVIQNSDSSIFSIASIAKQFTASSIWSLVQENKISLDDDVRRYIPELPFYGDTIRIRHMLNHTSGIRNYQAIMELAGFDYDKEFYDNQYVLELACKQKELNNRPGDKVIYGNTAYTLLAIVVERITGQNLGLYAKNKIFLPLGMSKTFYRVENNSIIKNRAVGYVQNNDNSYSQFPSIQLSYGAGSMGSSIEDLSKWSNVLNGLNADYMDLTKFLTTLEVLNTGYTAKYARGIMVDNYKEKKTIHHSGYGLGGQSQIIAVPELKIAIILLTNLESIDPSLLSYKILDLFLPDQKHEQRTSSKPFNPKRKELLRFVGQYKELNSDMKMEITLENDTLKSLGSQGKKPIALVPSEKDKFYRMNNSNVQYDFVLGAKYGCDLIVYFGGTPFYFLRAQFINPDSIILKDFVGKYHSSELSVNYEIVLENGDLFLSYPNHSKIKLIVGQKDEFGNGSRILYSFSRNENNVVTKLYLAAEGTVKNIEFIRK